MLYVVLACTILLFWRGDSPVSAFQAVASHPARREFPSATLGVLLPQYPASPTLSLTHIHILN